MYWLKLILVNSLLIGLAFAKVYEIVEPDMLTEIESRKNEFIKNFAKESVKAEERLYSKKGVSLPPSKKNYIYYVDPTIELQADIPKVNKKGEIIGILYKKGTKINPFDYLPTRFKPPPMIIFNACSAREIFLVKKLIKEKNLISYILVSGGCSIKDIKENKVYKQLEQRIYLLTKELKDKLKLKNTISFVDVDFKKRAIKVEVYKVSTD